MPDTFNWGEGSATVSDIVKALATALTAPTTNKWTLEYPASINDVDKLAILSTTTSFNKKFYTRFERPNNAITYMMVTIGTELLPDKSDFVTGKHDEPSRWAWYRVAPELYLGEWVPVKYYMSFNTDYANIILQGEDSPDVPPYKNYLISPCFLGACKSYEGADQDTDYNFFKTVGSDIEPTQATTFGLRTATGVLDASFVGTRSGMPYQAHTVKYFADNTYRDKNRIQSSAWTHKEHASEIVFEHATDQERGMLQNALVLDRSAIFHLTELIIDKGLPTEKIYIMFNISAPYWILNGGANPTYGVALRKS